MGRGNFDINAVPSSIKANHHLAVTCLDQVDEQLSYINNEKIYTVTSPAFLKKFSNELEMTQLFCSYGPTKNSIVNWQE
ncbi:MAG: hypothetical protein JSS53_09740 [Proteobacteria bacterium]|nr:hypothetical protein [Pseudomonadota bacterium]